MRADSEPCIISTRRNYIKAIAILGMESLGIFLLWLAELVLFVNVGFIVFYKCPRLSILGRAWWKDGFILWR
jgi:hypothetical protein